MAAGDRTTERKRSFELHREKRCHTYISTNYDRAQIKVDVNLIQWNVPLYSGHPWGTTFWLLYIGVAFIEGLFCTQTVHLGPGCLAVISQLAFIQGWPLIRGVPL